MQIITGKMIAQTIDSSAQAYLTAANILPGQIYAGNGSTDFPLYSERVIKAVNNIVLKFKAYGYFSRMKCFYPILGLTNNDTFVNLINPGTNNLTPVGSFTASITRQGIAFDGASMLDTGILLSEFSQDSMTVGYYYNLVAGGFDWGTSNGAEGFLASVESETIQFRTNIPQTITTPAKGLTITTVTGANRGAVYTRGILNTSISSTDVSTNISYNPNTLYIGGYNGGSPSSLSTIGCFFMMDGASSGDVTNITSIIEEFMFEIGRNSGGVTFKSTQFLGDSITNGITATPIYHAWPTGLCYHLGETSLNYGAPGHMITDCNTTDILNLLPYDSLHQNVFLAYSTNDFIQDLLTQGSAMTLSLFTSTYATVLGKILAQGYPPSNIYVITGYFCGADQYNYTLSSDQTYNHDGTQGDASLWQDNYLAAARTESLAASIPSGNIINFKTIMIAAGATDSNINGIHPGTFWYDYITSYLIGNFVLL